MNLMIETYRDLNHKYIRNQMLWLDVQGVIKYYNATIVRYWKLKWTDKLLWHSS